MDEVRQLNDAAMQGNIERVGALLDQGVAVDSRNDLKWTPLFRASIYGRRAVAALLLDRGANVNAENAYGDTPAIHASGGGHLNILQLLVSRGADIHHRNRQGYSSLLHASGCDHLHVCEYLLSLGADLMVVNHLNRNALTGYGCSKNNYQNNYQGLSPEAKALGVAALEAWWAAGPHPSQVQRRRDERWARRGPLLRVLAEHAYRPLRLTGRVSYRPRMSVSSFSFWRLLTEFCDCWPRSQHIATAVVSQAAPLQAVALSTRQQRHAVLLGLVFSCEDIVRLLVAWL